MRDSQRQKCYDWEWEVKRLTEDRAPFHNVDYKALREYMYKVTWQGDLGKTPALTIKRAGSTWSHAGWDGIRLAPSHMNLYILTHELAHCIVARWFGRGRVQAHGREFVGIAMHLYERNLGISRELMLDCARQGNLDFANLRLRKKDMEDAVARWRRGR